MAPFNKKMYHMMQNMVETNIISVWEKTNTKALLHSHGHHPISMGPRWASFIIQEPMIVPTPGGKWTALP